MDVVERLSLEAVSEHTSQACEHLHRYEFAGALCDGLRVLDLACGTGYGSGILAETVTSVHGIDNDVASIDLAAATVGKRTAATFEAADAVAYLDRELVDQYDAIVCFEGLEHLADLSSAVGLLSRHASRGVQLVASVPNSKTFGEENPFHFTDFDYDSALELLKQLSGGTMLYQHLLEGSLIHADDATDGSVKPLYPERAEARYANHFILIVNVDRDRVAKAQGGRRLIAEAPVHNRYMRGLEVANQALRQRNAELTRRLLGAEPIGFQKAGSAAPAFLAAHEKRIAALDAEAASLRRKLSERDGELAHCDDMILAQRRELLQLRQELVARSAVRPRLIERLRGRVGPG